METVKELDLLDLVRKSPKGFAFIAPLAVQGVVGRPAICQAIGDTSATLESVGGEQIAMHPGATRYLSVV